jgi:hypothetical protein
MSRKGVSVYVSAVIYTAIVVVGIGIVLKAGIPAISAMKDVATLSQAKDMLSDLDAYIQEVASEGRGSSRIVPVEIRRGVLTVKGEEDIIDFCLDTKSKIVAPRSVTKEGNLYIASNVELRACEGNTTDCLCKTGEPSCYVMENSYLYVELAKIGDADAGIKVPYQMEDVVRIVQIADGTKTFCNKDYANLECEKINISVTVNGGIDYVLYGGYTKLKEAGSYLPYGNVIAYMEMYNPDLDRNESYEAHFILESKTDFLQIKGKNFEVCTEQCPGIQL